MAPSVRRRAAFLRTGVEAVRVRERTAAACHGYKSAAGKGLPGPHGAAFFLLPPGHCHALQCAVKGNDASGKMCLELVELFREREVAGAIFCWPEQRVVFAQSVARQRARP